MVPMTRMLARLLTWSLFFFVVCAAAQDPGADPPQLSNSSDRFQTYLQRTYSWQKMSWLAVDTGIDHLLHESEWGRGMGGYGCHYASGCGRRLINSSVEFGATLVSRQDTRFRPPHRTGLLPRLDYALTHAFLVTSESRTVEPALAPLPG